jgi:hypothetical protein
MIGNRRVVLFPSGGDRTAVGKAGNIEKSPHGKTPKLPAAIEGNQSAGADAAFAHPRSRHSAYSRRTQTRFVSTVQGREGFGRARSTGGNEMSAEKISPTRPAAAAAVVVQPKAAFRELT